MIVTVPVPVTARLDTVGFNVMVEVCGGWVKVGGNCVWVGSLVAVITTGVLLGMRVGLGRDWTVCSTWTATVA